MYYSLYIRVRSTEMSFPLFVMVLSLTNDYSETVDGIRGDGLCSLWAVVIGFCFRFGENKINFRQELISDQIIQPTNIKDILKILMSFCTFILDNQTMLEDFNYALKDESLHFKLWEIKHLIAQLTSDSINTLQGDAHFKMLALLLNISIHVYSTETKQTFIFGKNKNAINIQTNGAHYSLLSNHEEVYNYDFTSYWWKEQWRGHPLNTDNTCIYVPTLTK